MKKVTLKVKKNPLTPEIHIDKYELVAGYMHGDADGDTSKTIMFDALNVADVEKMKWFLAAYDSLDDCEYLEDQAKEFFMANGMDEDEADELSAEFGDEFYEGDMTCDGMGASHTGIELFFWNFEGQKFEVTYKVKK